MKPSYLCVLALLISTSLLIIPVSAETITGTITGGSGWLSDNYAVTAGGGANPYTRTMQQAIVVVNIELTAGAKALVHYDPVGGDITSYDSGAPSGSSTSLILTYGTQTVATGRVGYQRLWDTAWPIPNEIAGYQYWTFDSWNITGLSGTVQLVANYSTSAVYHFNAGQDVGGYPSTVIVDNNVQYAYIPTQTDQRTRGNYTFNIDFAFSNQYTATKPSGLGITGNIEKTGYASKAIIYDGANNAPLASQGLVTTLNYTFNVYAQTIKLGVIDSNGIQHNTSVLFTTPTPSPTPTGTGTPQPGTWSNISFTTRYGVNNTVIPNVFVKLKMYYEGGPMGPDDWQQAVDGYTDANGRILFQEVDLEGWDFKATFTKPGLFEYGIGFDPTPYTWDLPVYLYVNPGGSVPGLPQTVNVTLQVKNAVTFAAIPSAWVTIGDSISGTAYQGQSTNATGYATFPGVPNTAHINGVITKSGYIPLTYWVTSGSLLVGDPSLTKYLYLATTTVTPTITPVTQEGITLIANPNSVAPGQSTTLTMTCANVTACTGAGGMHVVTYSEKYPDPSWDVHTIAIFHYNTSNSKYDYRPNADASWQVGTWTGLVATGTPTISGINTYYVNALRDDYYSIGQANVGVLVTGAVAGNLNMKLSAGDQTTGAHLYNYQMNLTNRNTGATTEFNTVVYEVNKLLPRGQDYTVQCSKDGYLPGTNDFTVPTNPNIVDGDMGTFVSCPLYPTGSISAGNTTVTVKVFDAENYIPLPNVQVQMSAPIIYSDSPKYTGGDGSGVFFILGQNQPYSVTASKSGYCAVTDTGNTSTLNTKNVYLNLKYGSCMGPTPTPTPTPGPTGTGGPGVIVTPTTFQAGNATTFWRPWINVFNMMGANAGEINLLLAGLIIVLLMAVGGGVAGVLGAEVFMGFGAIFCVAVGLIPIWVVLAIIILGFLFYGLKIGR